MSKFQNRLESAKKGTITDQEIAFQTEDALEALDSKIRGMESGLKKAKREVLVSVKPGITAESWVDGILNASVVVKGLEVKIAILEEAKKEYFS